MKGIILSKTYGVYNVLSLDNNNEYILNIRGTLKKNKDIYVGDIVIFDESNKIIEDVIERNNFLIRPSIANLDYLIIVSSFLFHKTKIIKHILRHFKPCIYQILYIICVLKTQKGFSVQNFIFFTLFRQQ